MPDPGWAARTPEDNDLLLKAGTGVGAHVANQSHAPGGAARYG
jgi:hypothetical protein